MRPRANVYCSLRERSGDGDAVLRREGRMRTYRNPAWCGAMLTLVIICGMGGTAAAQWLSVPVPGTPRTADGKANLNAPTPRTADRKPDLSGIWRADSMRYNENL